MGGAYFLASPPAKPLTPMGLRAPELVLSGTVNKTLDIWAWGCFIFELVTGERLFCVAGGGFEDDDHLMALTERPGPLPDELFQKWENSSRYFTPDRKLFNSILELEEPEILEQETMEEAFDLKAPELDAEEAAKVKALVQRVLQYDPDKRPSPAELLRDPWFEETESQGGSSE
ncbi:kinase-like protein [Parathielavia hyrcaniae]|uniref:Kinase-like protein n=1 Tax=Parathielavia hyrcaniae TaxID=113614 RepID=A0AAN6SX18_9PEZI|nr:kinase-like protein [Parathielavia hyrcaniae]